MKRRMTVAAALVGAVALFLGVNSAASAHHPGAAGAKGPLNQLVTAGTITQAEADAFIAAFKPAAKSAMAAAKAERKSDRDQVLADLVSNGTLSQSAAEIVKSGGKALRDAVKSGAINWAQLGAIRDAMKQSSPGKPLADLVKQVTDKLVSENKISSASAAAIVTALPADRALLKGKGKHDKRPGFGGGFGKGHGGKEKRS